MSGARDEVLLTATSERRVILATPGKVQKIFFCFIVRPHACAAAAGASHYLICTLSCPLFTFLGLSRDQAVASASSHRNASFPSDIELEWQRGFHVCWTCRQNFSDEIGKPQCYRKTVREGRAVEVQLRERHEVGDYLLSQLG
jgi:hypothetical protein